MKFKDVEVGKRYAMRTYVGYAREFNAGCVEVEVIEKGSKYLTGSVDWQTGYRTEKDNGLRVKVIKDGKYLASTGFGHYDRNGFFRNHLDPENKSDFLVLLLRGPADIVMPWNLYEPKLEEYKEAREEQARKDEQARLDNTAKANKLSSKLKDLGLDCGVSYYWNNTINIVIRDKSLDDFMTLLDRLK